MRGTGRRQGREERGWGSTFIFVNPRLWFRSGGVHLPHGTASVGGLALTAPRFSEPPHLPPSLTCSSPLLLVPGLHCPLAAAALLMLLLSLPETLDLDTAPYLELGRLLPSTGRVQNPNCGGSKTYWLVLEKYACLTLLQGGCYLHWYLVWAHHYSTGIIPAFSHV